MQITILFTEELQAQIDKYRRMREDETGLSVSFGEAFRELARIGAAAKGFDLPPIRRPGRPVRRKVNQAQEAAQS